MNHQAEEIIPDTPSLRVAWLSSPGNSELPPSLPSSKNAQLPDLPQVPRFTQLSLKAKGELDHESIKGLENFKENRAQI